jgi:hypothetical protein
VKALHFKFAVLPIAVATVSCQPTAQPAPTTQRVIDVRKEAYWQENTLPLAQDPVAVATGPSPLVYIFDVGAPIRIIDLTAKSTVLSTDVPSHTLVSIDEHAGVTIGRENLVPGPLPAGHQYSIFADPQTANVIRRGLGPPGNVPKR